MFRPMLLIDLIVILPFYLAFVGMDLRSIRVLRVVRIFRLLKLVRYVKAIAVPTAILSEAFNSVKDDYKIEKDKENIKNL